MKIRINEKNVNLLDYKGELESIIATGKQDRGEPRKKRRISWNETRGEVSPAMPAGVAPDDDVDKISWNEIFITQLF